MLVANERPEVPTAIRIDLGAIFVSLELSRSKWLITSLSPDSRTIETACHETRPSSLTSSNNPSRPLRISIGDGGHPGICRSTGTTLETPPITA